MPWRSLEIPYGAYWSTPFCKWQGSLSHLHALEFAAHVAKRQMDRRQWQNDWFDHAVLGTTIPQPHSFYGAPWLTGLMELHGVTGPTINQACATGVRSLASAAGEIAGGMATTSLVVTADRTSNGAHLVYPAPHAAGGTVQHENWVMDNFGCDPLGRHSMLQTAENVARHFEIDSAQMHEVVLRRQEQYQMALANDMQFQKRFMTLPFAVPDGRFRKDIGSLDTDEGVYFSDAGKLGELRPVLKDGAVTFAAQTHPADGNAALVLCQSGQAEKFATDSSIRIRIKGFGQARVELAMMPRSIVPATQRALRQSALDISNIKCVKTHNPFAVNDIVFSRECGFDLQQMNNYGCSLVWGHPQGPTGLRGIIELIEELVIAGGGYGLFVGCAAGDSAMATVLEVTDRNGG
ncbi:MAG: thiolase family protein [Gammaproteobacteria bacterium]|nr:thiolase family protein [Gammaproteobacteria bacterium]